MNCIRPLILLLHRLRSVVCIVCLSDSSLSNRQPPLEHAGSAALKVGSLDRTVYITPSFHPLPQT